MRLKFYQEITLEELFKDLRHVYNVDSLGLSSFLAYRKYKLDQYDRAFKQSLGDKLNKLVNENRAASIKYNDVFLHLVLAESQHDLEISLASFKLYCINHFIKRYSNSY